MAIVLETKEGDWIREGDFYFKVFNGKRIRKLNGKYLSSPAEIELATGREIDFVARKLWGNYNGINS